MSKKTQKYILPLLFFGALCYIYSDSINKNKYKIKHLNATRLADVFFVSS